MNAQIREIKDVLQCTHILNNNIAKNIDITTSIAITILFLAWPRLTLSIYSVELDL